jgi:hypothetical protein
MKYKSLNKAEIEFIRECRKKGLTLRDIVEITQGDVSLSTIYNYTKDI